MSDSVLSIELACKQASNDYPGGVAAVAAIIGCKASTLQNKLNPTQTTHKLLASEAEGILQLTSDARIMDAVCAQHGGAVWVNLGRVNGTASDMAMLDNITELVKRVGDLSARVHESLADGVVDRDELARLETATLRLTQSAFQVLERAKQFQ